MDSTVVLGALFLGGLFIATSVLAAYAILTRSRRTAWKELADRTGLTFHPAGCMGLYGWGSVSGLYRDRGLKLYDHGDSVTESLVDDTKILVAVSCAGDAYFSLGPPMYKSVARRFPPKDWVQTGDAAFDEAFLLRGRPQGFVAAVFSSVELRKDLLRLRPGTGLVLRGQQMALGRNGIEQDVGYLQFLLDLLCDLAERLEQIAETAE